jgi:heme/copper-type cytochrome/quinol oxidase subunit 2
MGIWAIAVGSAKSSGINWTIIGIITVVIIVAAIITIFLIARRKPKEKQVKS